MEALGIDVGGTGIKGAVVDTATGQPLTDRFRVETPKGGRPEPVIEGIAAVRRHFNWNGPMGCGFPAAVRRGVVLTAANIDRSWIGIDLQRELEARTGAPAVVLNDADAAGQAEMAFGAGAGVPGTVFVITLGTGIGTALFSDGKLVPNTELGHLIVDGKDAERMASEAAKKREDLGSAQWGQRLSKYLSELERLFWPDLFIIGGGGAKKFPKLAPHLVVRTRIVTAAHLNMAGIIGAAAAMARATTETGVGGRA
jgi:polyphosphate glucokinase